MNRFGILCLSLVASVGFSCRAAHSAIIVHDTFTRTGALIGSTADSGQSWTGTAPTSNANGSKLAVTGTSGSFATISGLTFQPNSIYNLSVEVSLTAGGNEWLGIGFSRPTSLNATSNTNGFFLRRHNPQVETRVTGSSSTAQSFAVANTFPSKLEVILVTGATLSDSLLSWELNDSALRTDEPVNVTGINGIFLANVTPFIGPAVVGTYDDLLLTVEPVPEPGTATLLALGAAALVGYRQRNRRRRLGPERASEDAD